MHINRIIFLLFPCFFCTVVFGQSPILVTEGVIEFEKTVNKYAVINKIIKSYEPNSIWQDQFTRYKGSHQQFLKLGSTLTFSKSRTLFVPMKYTGDPNENLWNGKSISDQINTVYSDFSTNTNTTEKKMLDELFLVKDSLRSIKWKITNETREIAGFHCRRANGLVMDSLYVVAFYTNEIPIASGPESFTGLPGMILGLALPYENVTWFAIKVTEKANQGIVPPKRGKQVTYQQFKTIVENTFKGYGLRKQMLLKDFLL
ncbi:GLPGLI family protein [Pedobacter polaris]|uniref:GLPGLI family protein n=1 Tax=Pedobacter polaris TaxID=2571273 RepID=A0A4U1CQX6_9SPHI|nr:GLPGLI family protein [Pedobacter polaris]TKC08001.1 GLPGLI family protein [Pedobacter polaris]